MPCDEDKSRRNTLSPEGRKLRQELYKHGHVPSPEDKNVMHQAIKELPGNGWYSRKRHLTWCSRQEKELEVRERELRASTTSGSPSQDTVCNVHMTDFVHSQIQLLPDPPLSVLMQWATYLNAPVQDVTLAAMTAMEIFACTTL